MVGALVVISAPSAAAESKTRIELAPPAHSGAPAIRLELRAKTLTYRPDAGCAAARCSAHIKLRGAVRIDARCQRRAAEAGSNNKNTKNKRDKGKRSGCRDFSVRASRVDITLDARGKARVVDARGDVSLRSGSRHGHAEQLTLLPQRRRLELSGKARLVDKTLGAELAGARVALDLESGAVEVLDARASFGRPRQRRDR